MDRNLTKLKKIAIEALENAHGVHETIGKKGTRLIRKNQFGETALKLDLEAEKAVLDTFRKHKFPIRIICEESGTVDIVKKPKLLGVLDGLDGTNRYLARQKGDMKARYGTMLGIFSSLNPCYGDYLFSGIIEHPTKKLFFCFEKQR